MASLENKVIIITGTSSGIGAQTALYLSQYKPRLVLVARRQELLEKVAAQCKDKGLPQDKILILPADLSKMEDLDKIVSETIKKFGQIDVLVNNAAAMAGMTGVGKYTPEAYQKIMDVNLKAPMFLSQAAVPHLKKTKGSIINISSTAATEATPFFTIYCASKAGLDQFTKCLALELAPFDVRVNSIRPGLILTDTMTSIPNMAEKVRMKEMGKSSQPLRGAGEGVDIAKIVKFLASDDAGFMTGESMYVDGGRHLIGASASVKMG
ncbi:dehydrogenase/reductase SDR family member 4-like isoform X1 [Haliotis rubra]|uniref:dehydrogenase/reductase SDR family member 4-like isoform X1 n=1 Tax=Haliotis rubra TaxID=36100 RepID=UPI001EE5C556|nr:dehydrogenase/reductase SDR family member 4-like isoform X1 [Haliotis rubra]XP_046553541.1 dehydrogenase/reductase SDR family member 4-like isoform X1 [Haliotis rubra]